MSELMDTIYGYYDYRLFLKDNYVRRKSSDAKFSYRFIAKEAGLRSSSYFLKIIDGERDISVDLSLRLAKVFRLKKLEADYFELLVQFNQAKTQTEKAHFYSKLGEFRKSKAKVISPNQFEIFDKWHYVAIREIFSFYRFNGDCQALGRMLIPPISSTEAAEAVQVLERLGFILRTAQGGYQKADPVISTGSEWKAISVANFQLQSLELARHAFNTISRKECDLSTLTLSVSPEILEQVKDRLKKCRESILELTREEVGVDRVYQLNLQLFPLSKTSEGG